MRIISGQSGGVPIAVPKTVLRPTAERVREAVFSMLGERVQGAVVLDLFSGSGAYGLECLSRGAAAVTFVETERAACDVIRQNLTKARLANGSVVCANVEAFLRRPAVPCHLVFADPPYHKSARDRDWDAVLLESAEMPRWLMPEGLFVLESFTRSVHPAPAAGPWEEREVRRYGDAAIRFFSLHHDARSSEMAPPPGAAGL
ncbi:MAG: RsmD family RNA methyltransferase [Verrucomicrobiales bacterium]|nr:RsmD family RNA methyltransferase [Verrucomicrobiales bacterium]